MRCAAWITVVWLAMMAVVTGPRYAPADDPPGVLTQPESLAPLATTSPTDSVFDLDGDDPAWRNPRWTVEAGAVFLRPQFSSSRSVITDASGATLLSADGPEFDFATGPRVSLIRRRADRADLELTYFGVDGWYTEQAFSGNLNIGPNQFGSSALIVVDSETQLFSGELNVRGDWLPSTQWLAGFRLVELFDTASFSGSGGAIASYDQHVATDNHLYGFQFGLDGTLMRRGGFSFDALAKAGVYKDIAGYGGDFGVVRASRGHHTSFLGELEMRGQYRIAEGLSIYGGYQVLWLESVALALEQLPNPNGRVRFDGSPFYHGATCGLEFVW